MFHIVPTLEPQSPLQVVGADHRQNQQVPPFRRVHVPGANQDRAFIIRGRDGVYPGLHEFR